MTLPLFSIVLPTYNRSDLLGLCLRSILWQTTEDYEVIVTDNCSTDATRETVQRFSDPRIGYARTPRHVLMADNWEHGRERARGRLILVLADDDALVPTALEEFAAAYRELDASFLFCTGVEYFDSSYPGARRNVLRSSSFTTTRRRFPRDEFLGQLCSFEPGFNLHPSSFVFERSLADSVARRCGRFFATQGVEFFAWPAAAAVAEAIAYVDLPLAIAGRTQKSTGTNLFLENTGHLRLAALIEDLDHRRAHAPLANFTMANLMAEGILTAMESLPEEFASYAFDERAYLRRSFRELSQRQAQGIDVSLEMNELATYAQKYPRLRANLFGTADINGHEAAIKRRIATQTRRAAYRALVAARRFARHQVGRTRMQESAGTSPPARFELPGEVLGFSDMLGAADCLARVIERALHMRSEGVPPAELPMARWTGEIRNPLADRGSSLAARPTEGAATASIEGPDRPDGD